jgi:hypothetical protein
VVAMPKASTKDVLKALKTVQRKFAAIAHNEQVIETRLNNLDLRLQALDINLLNAVNWIILWIIYTPYTELDCECFGLLVSRPRQPYWI